MWDAAIGTVKTLLPNFNDYLITGYREEQVRGFAGFIDTVFKEAVLLFNGRLKYLGYAPLSPERRIAYSVENALTKGRVNIQQSEWELMEYNFEYEGTKISTFMYVPYMHHGSLMIHDTRYYLHHPIIERTIYRVTDGIGIKVMRSPLQFWRSVQYVYTSSKGNYCDAIITVKAHYRKTAASVKKMATPLLLYLLSRYDFENVLFNIMGLPPESVSFVTKENVTDEEHEYFKCRDNVYLKVHTESVMSDIIFRRVVASLLYTLTFSKRYGIHDVTDITFYKTLLGKNLYGQNTKEVLAANHADSHLESLESYLDQLTRKNLEAMSVYCSDVFELFVAVFFNIDSWLLNYSPNNLFDKQLGGAEQVLSEITKAIFTRFYETLRKNKTLKLEQMKQMLKIDPMRITTIYKVDSIQSNSAVYNDNMLISTYCKKVRMPATRSSKQTRQTNLISANEHKFHPSFLAIESALSISSSSPGVSGDMNPFAVIDNRGCFQKDKMPWYKEIESLAQYLIQV